MGLTNKSEFEHIKSIDVGTAGYRVFYVEDTGNKTYEEDSTIVAQTATAWVERFQPMIFDIENTGTQNLVVQFNDDGVDMTIKAGKGMGGIAIHPYIRKVTVQATGTYTLMLRN